ncbi:MAG: mitochondrial fission ELM1 family protein [Candidatus Omnitrophica bacterium]|nr:mitochondrial fission ELM1 family protein [Candidatus Omnitrophota bacterium]
MKASFYTESILYWLVKGVSFTAQRLPAGWNTSFGAGVGTLLYHLFARRRSVGLANLRAAFGNRYAPAEYQSILKGMFRNLGMQFMEMAAIPAIDKNYVDRWIAVAPGSRERLEKALAEGKGVIFLTGHFGNWELISITGALHGFPTMVLAREQGWPKLNRLLTRYRESKGCKVITKGFPIREMIRGLEEGKIVGILADQDGGRNGILVSFFGRLASTAPGAIALSINTGAPVLPVFMVRDRGPAHTLAVGEPLEIPAEGSLEERIQRGIAAYLQVLERQIRAHPSQWLWLHRRWKSSPQRKVVIFSDGKAGHLSQSKAFAQRIEQAWAIKTRDDKRLKRYSGPLVSTQTVRVAYRGAFRRFLLALAAACLPRKSGAGDFWLKVCLTPESYGEICSLYGNIGVSCGASTAPVNLLWGWGIGAKTVHITRVRWPSWRRFDLAVIPNHDRPPRGAANLLAVEGAVVSDNGASPDEVQRWRGLLSLKKKRQIGLLVGGPVKGIAVEPAQIERMLEGILEAADKLDAELLVTSSRRTPPEVEEVLLRRLKKDERCPLLVLVNQRQAGGLRDTAEAVPCILRLSEWIVVSGESISMVCESAATDKRVVAFLPASAGRFAGGKYRRFLDGMESKGRVAVAEPEKVGEALESLSMRESLQTVSISDHVTERLVQWL